MGGDAFHLIAGCIAPALLSRYLFGQSLDFTFHAQGGVRVNAWLFSPTLIADPGTAATPRYETGLMHITDMIPTLVRVRCNAVCCKAFD